MASPNAPNRSTTLERARRRFEHWRRARRSGARIPNALWALAVAVAREHGVNPTSECLHVDFNHLKKRLATGSSPPRESKDFAFGLKGPARPPRPSTATFVELTPSPSALSPCTIELENVQGAKMKIHLASPEAVDLVALSRSLWVGKR
ncbi:MAG: hypothetical protein ACRD2G_10535 [Terriglobia bacterium]